MPPNIHLDEIDTTEVLAVDRRNVDAEIVCSFCTSYGLSACIHVFVIWQRADIGSPDLVTDRNRMRANLPAGLLCIQRQQLRQLGLRFEGMNRDVLCSARKRASMDSYVPPDVEDDGPIADELGHEINLDLRPFSVVRQGVSNGPILGPDQN